MSGCVPIQIFQALFVLSKVNKFGKNFYIWRTQNRECYEFQIGITN